ncbi:MAG TPA: FAD-binding oxidoreductase [Thermomicrobiales bacterium]|nr:FAD-binding oxidoreductase [Thermomicrobiales bacterium]
MTTVPTLPSAAEVVIVGAGIMGCSIACHLAERGLTDVVILERDSIGRGATADAAGGIRLQFSTETNIRLSQISLDYWEHFDERFDASINFRQQGYVFLLTDERDVDIFRRNLELQQSLGVPSKWVTTAEIAELNPAVVLNDVLGGTFCPLDGWADTSTSTMGFARAARRRGVRIFEDTPVIGIDIAAGSVTGARTPRGTISTALVICCAGPQTRSVGQLAGLDIPILPYRRMSFITEPFAAIPSTVPMTIEFSRSLYFHPESSGFLFGMSNADEPSSEDKSVDDDWMATTVEALIERAPVFEQATVMRGWAGFYEVTPDDNPVLGHVPEIAGFIVAAGFSGHGFMQGPAIGIAIAELVIDGETRTVDLSAFRPGRFAEGVLTREHNVI